MNEGSSKSSATAYSQRGGSSAGSAQKGAWHPRVSAEAKGPSAKRLRRAKLSEAAELLLGFYAHSHNQLLRSTHVSRHSRGEPVNKMRTPTFRTKNCVSRAWAYNFFFFFTVLPGKFWLSFSLGFSLKV